MVLLATIDGFDSYSPMNVVVALVPLCFTLGALWLLWISACALWFWRRPLVEVDDEGVRLWALCYRRVPWPDIAEVKEIRNDVGVIGEPFVVLADRYRYRSIFWPFRGCGLSLAWRRDPATVTAAAGLIRSHPNYRGKANTE